MMRRTRRFNLSVSLCLGIVLASTDLTLLKLVVVSAAAFSSLNERPITYQICNGFTNQMLQHASTIALAISMQRPLQLPNAYITLGAQLDASKDVLPTSENSVPLQKVMDVSHLMETLEAKHDIQIDLLDYQATIQLKQPCVGLEHLRGDHHDLTWEILNNGYFQLTDDLKSVKERILDSLPSDKAEGICVHHRNGEDWKNHCETWSNNGKFHGHCKGDGKLLDALLSRGILNHESRRWIYYVGDVPGRMPSKIDADQRFDSYERYMLLRSDVSDGGGIASPPAIFHRGGGKSRDIWAWIDFEVCRQMGTFVGNSVSSWSALQLAERNQTQTYWYNKHSIPLGDTWRVFSVPIVYTYTEQSSPSGKYLLQASIASVRKRLPHSRIDILYHGSRDWNFRRWLQEHGVTIHQHEPQWKGMIELLRKKGNWKSSHLFRNQGNYLGTWQRIDIPKFIHTEYCLLLDSDTVLMADFMLGDLGAELTNSISMGAEVSPTDHHPLNAGVTLLNVPHLRKTYDAFTQYIRSHAESGEPFHPKAPSDQGAYLSFYNSTVRFLPNRFNFKPYWLTEGDRKTNLRRAKILHFHGIKPHQYLMAAHDPSKCPEEIRFLCQRVQRRSSWACAAQQEFASALVDADVVEDYCQAVADQVDTRECINVFGYMATLDRITCTNVTQVMQRVQYNIMAGIDPNDGETRPSSWWYHQRSTWIQLLLLDLTVVAIGVYFTSPAKTIGLKSVALNVLVPTFLLQVGRAILWKLVGARE